MAKVKPLLKILASVWIVYNIAVLMVMPNLSSYFGRITSKYVTPYANIVGLSTGWSFFSPDPVQPTHIKIVVNYPMAADGSYPESVRTAYPPDQPVNSLLQVRQISAMRFMIMDSRRLRQIFGPWLCKQYPGADSIDMEHVVNLLPPLDEAVLRKDMRPMEISRENHFAKETVQCNRIGDEEIL